MDDGPRSKLIAELRRQGINDERVLAALARVPREQFVPVDAQHEANENVALNIGFGQSISQPYIVALSTQALELAGNERVLEIGTGSGYQAAVLAELAREVYTVERIAALAWDAKERLDALGYRNIRFRIGDGSKGWSSQAPFDRILVTAAADRLPARLKHQLAVGGILVVPIGAEGAQKLYRLRKTGESAFDAKSLCDVRFVPLIQGE